MDSSHRCLGKPTSRRACWRSSSGFGEASVLLPSSVLHHHLSRTSFKHRSVLVDAITKNDISSCSFCISSQIVSSNDFSFETLACSAFMVVGAKHGCKVGEVEAEHKDEVECQLHDILKQCEFQGRPLDELAECNTTRQACSCYASNVSWILLVQQVEKLINELADAGAGALSITLDEGTLPRLSAYAKSVAHFPTAVKEARPHPSCHYKQIYLQEIHKHRLQMWCSHIFCRA